MCILCVNLVFEKIVQVTRNYLRRERVGASLHVYDNTDMHVYINLHSVSVCVSYKSCTVVACVAMLSLSF
jgi:hypothetical protein